MDNDEQAALCFYGDCTDENGPCSYCGRVNYRLLGYYGAVGRWAKAWGVSKVEAERRIIEHQMAAEGVEE